MSMSMSVAPLAPRAAAVVASTAIASGVAKEHRDLAADAREQKRKKRSHTAAFAPSHVGWLLKHEAVLHPGNVYVPPSFPRVKLTFLGKEIAGRAMAQLVAAAALAQAAEADHDDDFLCPPADALPGMREGLEEESLHASAAVVPLGPDAPDACPSKQ